jgi:hypothetical protein
LRIPYYLPQRVASRPLQHGATHPVAAALKAALEVIRRPILQLVEAASNPRVGLYELDDGWTLDNLEVVPFQQEHESVSLAGFPEKRLRLEGGQADFLALSEWRRGAGAYRLRLGMRDTLSHEETIRQLWRVAEPLLSALGLTGDASRMNVECLLHHIIATRVFETLRPWRRR